MNCVICGKPLDRDRQIELLLFTVARRMGQFKASEVKEEVARLGYDAAEVDTAFCKLLMAGRFVEANMTAAGGDAL
jgi:hypothetical protein